jgi:hypothetical protein
MERGGEDKSELFIEKTLDNKQRMGEKRNAYRLLVGKSEGKRPLGTPRRR